MMHFDYDKAVRIDAEEFLRTEITDWTTFPTVNAWISELRESLEFRSFVCGMSDQSMCDYNGTYPATETDIVPYMNEVLPYITGHFDADEINDYLKEYGLAFFDCIARTIAFDCYTHTPDFRQLVTELYTEGQKDEFTRSRDALIWMMDNETCTFKQALDMYDGLLAQYGKLKGDENV